MFKNKKFLCIFIVQSILPWFVAFFGTFAIHYFNVSGQYYREKLMDEYERTSHLCEVIYRNTMLYGIGVMAFMFILGLVAFIIMLINLLILKTKEKYSVARPLVIWLYSEGCILGTLILMLLVIAFTYGQSV